MELLWDDDPEELLLELGFGCDEPDLSGRIPARFINYQSQARGINLQVFLEAQRSRIDLENPNVSNRFRQLEVLQEVSVAFSSLAGPLKGYKDMSPEARDRRKRMATLFRKASKKSLSQLHNPISQELTVATAHNPSAPLLNNLEREYGPEECKVTFRRVKLQDTFGLNPFVEEEDGTESEVQNCHRDTVRNPDGEPRVGTLKDRFLDRVLQRKKSLQMRDSFEMEELGSFDDGGAAVEPAGTHFVRSLIRVNSCQSDSSGFLEDLHIPTVTQDATPAPDLIKALLALSGGSTDSHSGDIPPVTSNGTSNTSPEDQRKEHLTGTPSNHFQIATETLNNDPSLQSTEQTPQENGALSPRNDLSPPEFKGIVSMSSDKEKFQNVLGMKEKAVYFVSSLKNQDSSNHSEEFQIHKLRKSVKKKENQSSIKKKPIVITHFLSHEDSVALNKNSEELVENDQDAMDVESVKGSRLQYDVYLETDIDWQDVPQDVASVSCKDSVHDQNTKNEERNAMKRHSVVCDPDDSRAQSHVYLETEIDFQDETQDENFQSGQDPGKDTNTNNGETLKHNQDIIEGECVVSIPNSSQLQSNVYLETEIDWQDMTENSESKSEKSIPTQLIEVQNLDDVFETSVDASDVDDGDLEAFFQEMHLIGKVYWAEPIHISELTSQEAGSFEALDTNEENYEMEMKPHRNVLPSTDKSLWSNEKLFKDSMDFHNRNILNKSSVSLTSLDDRPSKRSISIQMLSNSTSHIVQRKDVPFTDNTKHANVSRYFKLDTSNPFRAVQSWTNLHIQYNSNIFTRNVSNSAGSNLNRPVESYWSPFPLLDHGWQSDDCVHKTFRDNGSPTVSMDTGLWADGEDEEVDLTAGLSGQNGRNGQTCRTCGRMCNCCKQDSQNTLSQKELEGILLYLKNFRSVLSLMEEQVTEEQTEVYSALTQQDRQCLEELLQLRQEVRQEALDLELQLSELVQHHDQSLTTNMWQLLNEQSLLCSQLQLCSPDHFISLAMPRSELVHKRTVATQCSPQLGPLHSGPLQVPRLPQTQTDPSYQGLGRAAAKADKRHLVGLLHRLRDSMRH